jgi:hypothetical protein
MTYLLYWMLESEDIIDTCLDRAKYKSKWIKTQESNKHNTSEFHIQCNGMTELLWVAFVNVWVQCLLYTSWKHCE